MRAQTTRTGAGTSARTPGRALLVIDQPVLAEVVKLALNHGRFHTAVATNAPEALAALRGHEADDPSPEVRRICALLLAV